MDLDNLEYIPCLIGKKVKDEDVLHHASVSYLQNLYPDACCIFYFENGNVTCYDGQFFKVIKRDNRVLIIEKGETINCQLHGLITKYNPDTGYIHSEITYEHGITNGEYRQYNSQKNGVLAEKGYLKNNLRDGMISIYDRGTLHTTVEYKNGKKHGVLEEYDPETGESVKSLTYQNDQLHGKASEIIYDKMIQSYMIVENSYSHDIIDKDTYIYDKETGRLCSHYEVNELGQCHGLYTSYDASGKIIYTIEYRDGKMHGKYIEYDHDYGTKTVRTYHDNVQQPLIYRLSENGSIEDFDYILPLSLSNTAQGPSVIGLDDKNKARIKQAAYHELYNTVGKVDPVILETALQNYHDISQANNCILKHIDAHIQKFINSN